MGWIWLDKWEIFSLTSDRLGPSQLCELVESLNCSRQGEWDFYLPPRGPTGTYTKQGLTSVPLLVLFPQLGMPSVASGNLFLTSPNPSPLSPDPEAEEMQAAEHN